MALSKTLLTVCLQAPAGGPEPRTEAPRAHEDLAKIAAELQAKLRLPSKARVAHSVQEAGLAKSFEDALKFLSESPRGPSHAAGAPHAQPAGPAGMRQRGVHIFTLNTIRAGVLRPYLAKDMLNLQCRSIYIVLTRQRPACACRHVIREHPHEL